MREKLIEIALFISSSSAAAVSAYTGYRRSIDGVLEAGSVGATNKSNANEPPHSSDVDVDNHNTLTRTPTIITQNTSSSPISSAHDQTNSENFIRHEQQAQAPPQPAPRTRLSSQNSVPMTNGDSAKADDASQVRKLFSLLRGFGRRIKSCR